MIDELINLLIDLAVNPDAQISEETLDRHQIADDDLRKALLEKDKDALARFLDPKQLTLSMANNGAIYVIAGDIETKSSNQAADITESGDITFVLESQTDFEITLRRKEKDGEEYRARVESGVLIGRQVSPAKEVGGSEGEAPSTPPAYQG